jgi:putative Holliday junction resolvase
MAYLGIDYGTKRIGLAYGELALGIAFKIPALSYTQEATLWPLLGDILINKKITHVVFGLPLNMDGSEGPAVKKVKDFAHQFHKHYPLPIFWSDERLTTEVIPKPKGVKTLSAIKKHRQSGAIDSQAAVLILQDYFDEYALHPRFD